MIPVSAAVFHMIANAEALRARIQREQAQLRRALAEVDAHEKAVILGALTALREDYGLELRKLPRCSRKPGGYMLEVDHAPDRGAAGLADRAARVAAGEDAPQAPDGPDPEP